jgi:hypothetical protein
MTPIQPRAAESNLFLISAQGPGIASFNEFNPLFTSDGLTTQLSGTVGEHDTYGGDAILAGIKGKAAFSIGYSGFHTDGVRVNNDQTDQIANAFVQYDFSPQAAWANTDIATDIGDCSRSSFQTRAGGLRNAGAQYVPRRGSVFVRSNRS